MSTNDSSPDPCCPKCGKKEFSAMTKTFLGTKLVMIYCKSCGAVLGFANKKEK